MSETIKTAAFLLGAIALVVAASVTQPEQRAASIFNDEGHEEGLEEEPLFPGEQLVAFLAPDHPLTINPHDVVTAVVPAEHLEQALAEEHRR